MKDASTKINEAKEQKQSKEDRNQSLEGAQSDQQKAADDLQRALDRMGNIGSLATTIEQIKACSKRKRR
jgi:hypothetical protein